MGTDVDISLEEIIKKRLHRIANVLLLNASFIDNPGLLNGKMGIAIFFYNYSKYDSNKIYQEYAGELIDEIYEEINTSTPVNFENGLTGIGWGIEYLVKNGFVQADTDKVLAEIDNIIYKHRINSQVLVRTGSDLFGYGFYYISRIICHKIDDNDLNTLIKKYHLIFLVDECERILEHRSFALFNIESLNIDSINSFVWFLLEVKKLNVFPHKVNKLFKILPDYLGAVINNSEDEAGLRLLTCLSKQMIDEVNYDPVKNSVKLIIEAFVNRKYNKESAPATILSFFVKNAWQELVYKPIIYDCNFPGVPFKKLIGLIDNEDNWNSVLDRLTSDNLGLTGLAGSGLGLLRAQSLKQAEKNSVQDITIRYHADNTEI